MADTEAMAPAVKPGRPRDPGADERILNAVVDELAEHGVEGFRINNVAARAKVAKRTLYSRWPERDDLILAGMSTLATTLRAPRTGSLVEDLRTLYDAMAATLDSPRWLIVARCSLELPEYPELYARFQNDCIDQPLAVVQDVLSEAQQRGELREGVALSVAAFTFMQTIAGFSTHVARLRGTTAIGVRDQVIDLFVHGLHLGTRHA